MARSVRLFDKGDMTQLRRNFIAKAIQLRNDRMGVVSKPVIKTESTKSVVVKPVEPVVEEEVVEAPPAKSLAQQIAEQALNKAKRKQRAKRGEEQLGFDV
jgi:hypothetical protein